ncbi:MAG TPA: SDR family oxidoreductase [Chitinophagales bacterium]|nr:SDR family oxidoreductase [Chitinophagales bacterium]
MNKKIVVTGATKGIGRAIADKFATAGWDVAICARSKDDLEAFSTSHAERSASLITAVVDVSKKEDVITFAEMVNKDFGAVDIVINNAGIFIPGQVINEEDGTLEKLIETNLYSAYHLTRTLLPGMLKKKSGHIFNLCSVASIQAYPNGGSYSISKFALLGFSKALREELKEHSIKVTALIAGATLTNSWKGTDLPDTRFMKPEDIAQSVWDVYHLSESTVVEEILLRPLLGDI